MFFLLQIKPRDSAQRRLCIRDLVNPQNGAWNSHKLVSVFWFHTALYIAVTFPKPPIRMGIPDKLIFSKSSHGNYTVKIGYHTLRGQGIGS
jgi:hypothetical protein